jgi:hypothetical protein
MFVIVFSEPAASVLKQECCVRKTQTGVVVQGFDFVEEPFTFPKKILKNFLIFFSLSQIDFSG